MLNKQQIKQTYNLYLQFEKAINKLSYNGLIDMLADKEVGDMCCELSDILGTVRSIRKERTKLNKLVVD